jgi:hypothetical protein
MSYLDYTPLRPRYVGPIIMPPTGTAEKSLGVASFPFMSYISLLISNTVNP